MQNGTNKTGAGAYDLVLLLWGFRKRIIGITLLGALAGVAAAFLMKPLFMSEVLLFPAITNSVSKSLLSEQSTGRDDILAVGDEEDAEQLMQMLNSARIRDRMARRFDLMTVYEIDPESPTRNSELIDAFADHISFERTKFGSVRVQVLDPDAQRAADIANTIADQVDTVWREMVVERASKGVALVEANLRAVEHDIREAYDSLRLLRGLGVHDYHTQSERYNQSLGAAIVEGDQRAVRELEDRFKMLAIYGGDYVAIQDRLSHDTRRATVLRIRLDLARADMLSEVPHKFVVDYARPADKKFSPVRWLVVAVSMATAFLVALLSIVVQVNINKIRNSNG